MDPIYHGDNEQKSFFQTIEKFTDRELQEKQAQYLWSIDKNTKRIKNNVLFFFYAFIASVAITLFLLSK